MDYWGPSTSRICSDEDTSNSQIRSINTWGNINEEPLNMSIRAYRSEENSPSEQPYDTRRIENPSPVPTTSTVIYPGTHRTENPTLNSHNVTGRSILNYGTDYNIWRPANTVEMPPAIAYPPAIYRQRPLAQTTNVFRPIPMSLHPMVHYPRWMNQNESNIAPVFTPTPILNRPRYAPFNAWNRHHQLYVPPLSVDHSRGLDYNTLSIRHESDTASVIANRTAIHRPTPLYPATHYFDAYNTWTTQNESSIRPAIADSSNVYGPTSIASNLNYPNGYSSWRTRNEDDPSRMLYNHPIYVPHTTVVHSSDSSDINHREVNYYTSSAVLRPTPISMSVNPLHGLQHSGNKMEATIHFPSSDYSLNNIIERPYNTWRSEFQSVQPSVAGPTTVNHSTKIEIETDINEYNSSDEEIIVTISENEDLSSPVARISPITHSIPIEVENISYKREKASPFEAGPSTSIRSTNEMKINTLRPTIAGPSSAVSPTKPTEELMVIGRMPLPKCYKRQVKILPKPKKIEITKPRFCGNHKDDIEMFIASAKLYFKETNTPPNKRVSVLQTMFHDMACNWYQDLYIKKETEEEVYQLIRQRFAKPLLRNKSLNKLYNECQKRSDKSRDFIVRKIQLYENLTNKVMSDKYLDFLRNQLRPKNQRWTMSPDIITIKDLLTAASEHDNRLTLIRNRRAIRLAALAIPKNPADVFTEPAVVVPGSLKVLPKHTKVIPLPTVPVVQSPELFLKFEEVSPKTAEVVPESAEVISEPIEVDLERADEDSESPSPPPSCKVCKRVHPQGKSYILAKIFRSKLTHELYQANRKKDHC